MSCKEQYQFWQNHNFCKQMISWNKINNKYKFDIFKVLYCNIFSLQKRSLMILLEDDIHFIHAKKSPRDQVTSTAWHMCTGLIDIHDNINSIQRPNTEQIHRSVNVILKNGTHKQVRGGADVGQVLQHFKDNGTVGGYFNDSYLEGARPEYRRIDLSIAKKSCENLRLKIYQNHK